MGGETAITILVQFKGGGTLSLDEYTTIDISRSRGNLHINVTNEAGGLAFNAIYEILELELRGNETFNITVQQGDGSATFSDMVVDYHINAFREILHFTKKQRKEDAE